MDACRSVRGRRTTWLLAAFVLAASASACSSASSDVPRTQPVTLHIGIALHGAAVKSFVSNLLFESVVGIRWDGRPVDRAVATWDWSDDKLSLNLHLRQNLTFHDGTPVDLQFFKAGLEKLFRSASPLTNVSFKSVTKVETDGKDTVVLKLSRPEAFLLTDLANGSIAHPTNPDIGFGPFKLVGGGKKNQLAAFDKYYQGRPNIDFVEVEEFDEQRGTWAALLRGDIDAVHEISPAAVDFVKGQSNVHLFPFMRPYYFQLVFNVRHPILKNPVVRQALSYGVDRQGVIDSGLSHQGTVAEGPIWPYYWAYSTAQKTYNHNAEAATLRLESAGLKLKPSPGRMPSRLRFRCLTVAKDARYEKIALVLQKQFYEIGVDMEIEALPAIELPKRLETGQFDTVLIERSSGRSLAWTYLSYHSSNNAQGYTAADGVLDRLRQTTDDAQIRTAVSELQQTLFDNPPAIFIAWPQVSRAVSTKFVVPDEKGRDVMSSLWQWRPSESRR